MIETAPSMSASPNQEPVLLRMEGISKSFPGVRALNNVYLEVRHGEVHALPGENGAGKSTLMKILSGAYTRNSGVITWEGRPMDIPSPKAAQELGIGIIYQEFNLVPQLSIAENVWMGRSFPVERPHLHENHALMCKKTFGFPWRTAYARQKGK